MTTTHFTKLSDIPVDQLIRGKFQPRQHFDEEQLKELAQSIKSTGELLQPIIVRPAGDLYEIIAGERRWRAAQLAGLGAVACLVKHYNDEQALEAAIIENVSRTDLNPIEEANAYLRLMEEFDYQHEEIAAMVGKSRPAITNALRMLRLDAQIQEWLIQGHLSEGHGKILAGLPASQQLTWATKSVKQHFSVRKLDNEIKKLSNISSIQHEAPKDPNIRTLERRLAEHIGCQVRIDFENQKGKLSIDFHDLDILEGVLKKIGLNE